jgi:uncharacterized protein
LWPEADAAVALSALAVLGGACIQGTGGIGFALFAAPIVALVRPELVPGPMLVLGGAVSLLAALRERRHIDYRAAGAAFAGRLPGSLCAGLAIGLVPQRGFSVLFALMILAAVALSLTARRAARETPLLLGVAGFASGFMGTITSVGTPPMGLVMQRSEPARLRATIGLFLLAGAVVSIAVLAWAGRFGWRDLQLSVVFLPPLVLGFWLSTALAGRIEPRTVRALVLGISALSALILLVQSR